MHIVHSVHKVSKVHIELLRSPKVYCISEVEVYRINTQIGIQIFCAHSVLRHAQTVLRVCSNAQNSFYMDLDATNAFLR